MNKVYTICNSEKFENKAFFALYFPIFSLENPKFSKYIWGDHSISSKTKNIHDKEFERIILHHIKKIK